jgi:hypothetical protein
LNCGQSVDNDEGYAQHHEGGKGSHEFTPDGLAFPKADVSPVDVFGLRGTLDD